MNSDDNRGRSDVAFRPRGVGHFSAWSCLGCGQLREVLGSKGAPGSVLRRCAVCVAAKAARAATA